MNPFARRRIVAARRTAKVEVSRLHIRKPRVMRQTHAILAILTAGPTAHRVKFASKSGLI